MKKMVILPNPATSVWTDLRRLAEKDGPLWIAAILTGAAAVGYAWLFRTVENMARHFYVNPWILFGLSPACFLVGWWLVRRFSPEAGGSGIPQVMAAIESLDGPKQDHGLVERLLGLRLAVVKVCSSLFCVLGSGVVGREGPTIQIAASIFHAAGKKRKGIFENQHFALIAGGAAGVAAAFNTPLGGLVFAIEELATTHFNEFKASLITAVIIAGVVAQLLVGRYLYLGLPTLKLLPFSALPWALVLGAATGLAGAFFAVILFKLVEFRRKLKTPMHLALLALACGLGLATLAVTFGTETLGSGRETILDLLFRDKHVNLGYLASRFLAPLVSYFSGCAGGFFAPSLAAGAAMGGILAECIQSPYSHLFILLGMIGFLTGVTRVPFTSFVLVLEMTDHQSAILPMMVAALTAYLVARMVEKKSFYEKVKFTYLPTDPPRPVKIRALLKSR